MDDVKELVEKERQLGKKNKKKKQPFSWEGPLWVVSLHGHVKLCRYQNLICHAGGYGCLDTFSYISLFLFLCFSNAEPEVIKKKYLKYLIVDRGTETGKMRSIYASLSDSLSLFDDPLDSIIYCLSTSNKIEQIWCNLHHRLRKYFKQKLCTFLEQNEYSPHNLNQSSASLYVFANNPTRL